MQGRSLTILAAVTAIAVAGAAYAVYQRDARHQVARPPAALFPGLLGKVNAVHEIEVSSPAGRFTIRRAGQDNWVMPSRDDYPVLFSTIKQVVVGMASLRPLESRTARPARYAKLHLDDPGEPGGKGRIVALKDQDGKPIAGMVLGKVKSIETEKRDGWYYARRTDDAQSWLVAGRIEVFEKPSAWLDPKLIIITRKRTRATTVRHPDGKTVAISRPTPAQNDFALDNVPEGFKVTHTSVPNGLGSALTFLSFDDVKAGDKIDFKDAVRTTYRTFDGLVLDIDTVERDGVFWARYKARFDPAEVKLEGMSEADRAEQKDEKAVKEQVADINSRIAPWAYQTPKFKADDFRSKLEDMITEADKSDS